MERNRTVIIAENFRISRSLTEFCILASETFYPCQPRAHIAA